MTRWESFWFYVLLVLWLFYVGPWIIEWIETLPR